MADFADIQAGRCGGGSCGDDFGRREVQPVIQKTRLRKTDCAGRSGESAVADSWFRI